MKLGLKRGTVTLEPHKLFVIGDFEKDTRSHHIHIVKWNGQAWFNYLNFRDYLNYNPLAALEYSRLKENLATIYAEDRIAYTEGKKTLIDEILERAGEWRSKGNEVHNV